MNIVLLYCNDCIVHACLLVLAEWNGFRKTQEKSISVLTAAMPEQVKILLKTTVVNKVLLQS